MSEGVIFSDGKAPDALRTIGEVSQALAIKQHVLRYWEDQFPTLKPLKRSGGRRFYRPEDIETVITIDRLVHREGYTLKGARKAIAAGGDRPAVSPPVAAPVGMSDELRAMRDGLAPAPSIAPQLQAIRNRLAAALAAA